MSDLFYKTVRCLGAQVLVPSWSPLILHRTRVEAPGPLIVAATHLSPYDIPCLMGTTSRVLDFVSITEVFRKPLVGWFFGHMGAFPLDRWHPDAPTVRIILNRLCARRVVVMFPEGGIRDGRTSVLAGGPMKQGVLRIAQLAGVPVVPCVVLGSRAYGRVTNWLPLRQTVWAANFGPPIRVPKDAGRACLDDLERQLRESYHRLHGEIRTALRDEGRRLTHDDFAVVVSPRPPRRTGAGAGGRARRT